MRGQTAALVGALLVMAATALACRSDRYYIGTYAPGAGTGGQGEGDAGTGGQGGAPPAPATCTAAEPCRFAVDLDRSGASQLPVALTLPTGTVTAALRYRGENAVADGWMADRGPLLGRASGAPRLALPTPLTDTTLAVGLAGDAPTYQAGPADAAAGAVDGDDFVVEVVLRAAAGAPVVARAAAGSGWSLLIDDAGALALELADGVRTVRLRSEVLVTRAWYHCLAWVSHAGGGRVDCDGRPGAPQDLAGLGALTSAGGLTVGGAASGAFTAPVQLALLQLFSTAAGGLGDPAGWGVASRTRFAQLTGVLPRVATGTRLPAAGLRDSVAYLDLQRAAGGERQLFLVGADWPRVACRSDSAGARDCGYLAEPARSRAVEAAARDWIAAGLTVVAPGEIVFVDGESRMDALIPSAVAENHRLTRMGGFSGPRQSFSFFAHAGAGHRVAAAVANLGTAIFDLQAGTVVSAPAAVTATIEAWGRGTFRCGYTFDGGGALDYQVLLVDDAGGAAFSGDQITPWIHVGGLQLDANQPYPASLLATSPQSADELTYVGDDGNLPTAATKLDVRVLLPAQRRLNDQALININRAGSFDDQVNLFLEGQRTIFKFWGLVGGGTYWTVVHPTTALDGTRRQLAASWGDGMARLWVDGVLAAQSVNLALVPPVKMDRIDVGFSLHSSGYLQGLLAGLQLKGP